MLQQNAFEDVGHILTAIGAILETLIDLFPLDDGHRVLLVLEQAGDRVPRDAIRVVLQAVHRDEAGVQIGRLPQLRDAAAEFFARPVDDVRQLDGLLRRLLDLVDGHPIRHRFDTDQHVVERAGQPVDVLPIDRRDEGLVQFPDDRMGDGVPGRLDPLDLSSLALDILVGLHHLLQAAAADDHVLRRLIEHLEKGGLAREKIEHTGWLRKQVVPCRFQAAGSITSSPGINQRCPSSNLVVSFNASRQACTMAGSTSTSTTVWSARGTNARISLIIIAAASVCATPPTPVPIPGMATEAKPLASASASAARVASATF